MERSAHKWARAGTAQEWEEKWGESYWSAGRAEKFADKWGREGGDVWHEKWGESYDGAGEPTGQGQGRQSEAALSAHFLLCGSSLTYPYPFIL